MFGSLLLINLYSFSATKICLNIETNDFLWLQGSKFQNKFLLDWVMIIIIISSQLIKIKYVYILYILIHIIHKWNITGDASLTDKYGVGLYFPIHGGSADIKIVNYSFVGHLGFVASFVWLKSGSFFF